MIQTDVVRATAQDVMNEFIARYAQEVEDYCHLSLEETGLSSLLENHPLKLTHFDDLYDTLLYSKLIAKALRMNNSIERIIDFGAGSSIPTLLALKETQHQAKVLAVDIDPEALEVSRMNAEKMGLLGKYSFHLGPMLNLLHSEEMTEKSLHNTLIVSNPPYIATPPDRSDYHLLPINGGDDGCMFVLDILKNEYPPNTTLALFWGSLCNPLKVVPAIEDRFDVLYTHAVKIHFGHYTNLPEVKNHLYRLRDEGRVSFDNTEKGETQIVLGTILRPR